MSGPKRRRGNYPKEKLQNAIRAVTEGSLTSVKASEFYGVPQSTIRSHVNHPSLRIGAGRSSHLNTDEENHLVDLIKSLEKIGVRLTRAVLQKVVIEYLRLIKTDPRWKINCSIITLFHPCSFHPLDNEPSLHWLRDFLLRNKKEIKMMKEKKLERSRRNGFSEEVRAGWFNTLEEILTSKDLMHKPLQIWNVDENGFADETQCEWIRNKWMTRDSWGGRGIHSAALTWTELVTHQCLTQLFCPSELVSFVITDQQKQSGELSLRRISERHRGRRFERSIFPSYSVICSQARSLWVPSPAVSDVPAFGRSTARRWRTKWSVGALSRTIKSLIGERQWGK